MEAQLCVSVSPTKHRLHWRICQPDCPKKDPLYPGDVQLREAADMYFIHSGNSKKTGERSWEIQEDKQESCGQNSSFALSSPLFSRVFWSSQAAFLGRPGYPSYSSPVCRGWSQAHWLPQPLCDLGELAGQHDGHMPKIHFHSGLYPVPWAAETHISPPVVPQSPWCLGKVSIYPIIHGLSLPQHRDPEGHKGLRHGGFSTSEPCSLGAKHPRTFAARRILILAQKVANAFPISGERERMHGRNP